MKLLGQDDWLFYARRDDGTLVWAVTELDSHWLFDTPHKSQCWDEATGRNCDGETPVACRLDCTWMHEHVRTHMDDYEWRECDYDPVDGSYLGWPPEEDEKFMAHSRRTHLID